MIYRGGCNQSNTSRNKTAVNTFHSLFCHVRWIWAILFFYNLFCFSNSEKIWWIFKCDYVSPYSTWSWQSISSYSFVYCLKSVLIANNWTRDNKLIDIILLFSACTILNGIAVPNLLNCEYEKYWSRSFFFFLPAKRHFKSDFKKRRFFHQARPPLSHN